MPKSVVVRDGDSIDSIAFAEGFFPDTLWDIPENASLKQLREDRAVLAAGDTVFVPDLRPKVEVRPTDQVHPFRRRGVPARFQLQYLVNGLPVADERYLLKAGSKRLRGVTDVDGMIDVPIPPNVTRGSLLVGSKPEMFLEFGHLDPIETLKGVKQRLSNLGYACGDVTSPHEDAPYELAVRNFQRACGLGDTGILNDATRDMLLDVHDSDER
jgi:hypothetical protein